MHTNIAHQSEKVPRRAEHAVGILLAGVAGYPLMLAGVMVLATVCANLFT